MHHLKVSLQLIKRTTYFQSGAVTISILLDTKYVSLAVVLLFALVITYLLVNAFYAFTLDMIEQQEERNEH